MPQEDYYAVLGLSAGASRREIKEAYRRLAFQHHPDRNRENPAAAEMMKRINEAYAVLSHPEKRREYNSLRRQFGSSASSRFRTVHSEEDIFSGSDINAIFEEMARAFGFRNFEDIFRDCYGRDCQQYGFKRPRVSVHTFVFGRGLRNRPDAAARPPAAGGALGRIARFAFQRLYGAELPQNGADIHDRVYLDPALAAGGGPYAYLLRARSKKLVVQIPRGIREGQRIRLAGMGQPGKASGRDGDLYLEVRLQRPWLGKLKQVLGDLWRPRT